MKGDIVIGKVIARASAGLTLKLVCTEGDKHLVLEELNIKSFCPTSHAIPVGDPKDPSRYYDVDDYIRTEVLEISIETEKLVTGMKGVTLSPELQHSFQLGLISRHDLPRYYT